MNMLAVIFTLSLSANCWGIPADMSIKKTAKESSAPIKKVVDMVDSELDYAIKSLNVAANMLKEDPAYQNLEKELENAIQDISDTRPQQKIFPLSSEISDPKETDSGLEFEYDNTKIILKKPQKKHFKKKVIKKKQAMPQENYQQQSALDNIVQQIKENFYPQENLFAQQNKELSEDAVKENVFEQEKDEDRQALENLFAQQLNEQREQEKEQMKNEQREQEKEQMKNEQREQEKEQMKNENAFIQQVKNKCDMKCETEMLTPVCAINVHDKYAIFENLCDMKVSNCYNPDLDWQVLPRELCKDSLHGFYIRLQKYFSQNTDQGEIIKNDTRE